MGIPLSGQTSSNGHPVTYYEYSYEFSNRTATSIHLKLWIRLRMRDRSSYFSFQIAHETKVFGGALNENESYQWAWIKQGRGWWGHQGSIGDGWLWEVGSYDYYGDNWHGWYLVFDGDVKVGVDDSRVFIVPVITRPPYSYNIYTFDWGWTPSQDIPCWEGGMGYWRPWSADEFSRSPYDYFYYTDHSPYEDMAFGNNRWLQPLADPRDARDGINVGAYPRPADVSGVIVSPVSIDVAEQDTRNVVVSWSPSNLASGYRIAITNDPDDGNPFSNVPGKSAVISSNYRDTSITFNPKEKFENSLNWQLSEVMDGDAFYVVVQAQDNAFVTSRSWTVAGPITYYERKSSAPDDCFIVGRNGQPNEVLFKGETARIYYSGQEDGSYPISRYCLVRQDGKELWWDASEEAGYDDLGGYVVKAVEGWPVPNESVSFELRAYNSKNRPVYLSSYNETGEGDMWFSFQVRFYGGILYVYGKESYTGDDESYDAGSGAEEWHEGLCRVYGKRYFYGSNASYNALSDSPTWHEAELVYVWDGSAWRSL